MAPPSCPGWRAGVSTFCGLAAGLLPRAAQVGGDAVNQMIGRGEVWFLGKPADEALWQADLRRPGRARLLPRVAVVCRQRNASRDVDDRFDLHSALSPHETAEQLVAEATDRTAPLNGGWHAWLRDLNGL